MKRPGSVMMFLLLILSSIQLSAQCTCNSLSSAGGGIPDVVFVDSIGHVGIGTTSPSTVNKLTLRGGNAIFDCSTGGETCTETLAIQSRNNAARLAFADGAFATEVWGRNGNLGIGNSNPTFRLQVNGNAAKTDSAFWNVASDARLKDIQADFIPGLEAVTQLQPVVFHYKAENSLDLPVGPQLVGLVAQDVQKVLPEAVSRSSSGYLFLDNQPVLLAMINAIKELREENVALKKLVCIDHPDAAACH